ncbi:MAG: 4-hydroxyphenylpyruvate dioxygenase [Betaproteobacteria bacterium]|nr:MAG: 4-hydroxyphenylpyruvate dioxygenase [Betaproteobacteria bacterium]TMH55968.1 MAG: 4-hydroxyphenylpyruvate dioxygenase [Betaproteobacteria bacterium]
MPALRSLSRRDRIAGLDRGLRLIEAFDETHPRLSPSTAARRTGVTRAAARRYLLTLLDLGYVESDGKLFWLTPRVLRLGWSYVDSAKVARIAQPFLQRLTAVLGGAAYFAVRDGDDVVFVALSGTRQVQNVGFMLGARVQANIAVAGIAMLSCWPQEEVERWLSGRVFIAYTPYTVTTVEGVRELIATARSRGYAITEQQLDPGMRGIAVPIRSRTSEVVGAISVSLPMGNESTSAATSRVLPVLREVEHSLLALL